MDIGRAQPTAETLSGKYVTSIVQPPNPGSSMLEASKLTQFSSPTFILREPTLSRGPFAVTSGQPSWSWRPFTVSPSLGHASARPKKLSPSVSGSGARPWRVAVACTCLVSGSSLLGLITCVQIRPTAAKMATMIRPAITADQTGCTDTYLQKRRRFVNRNLRWGAPPLKRL